MSRTCGVRPRTRRWRPLTGLGCVVATACSLAPSPAALGRPEAPLPPAGYGTLRQDDVTVAFSSGSLAVKVTPLAESVILVTAPDTYERLASLAELHRTEGGLPEGPDAPVLLLVSFFSDAPDVSFVPEELQLISRGIRHRPTTIRSVTPGWGQRRLQQRQTEMAVYVFPPAVDLESDLTVAYGLVESQAWTAILPRIQAERTRARARAGVGS